MENTTQARVLDTEAAHFEIKDGIIYARYKPDVVVTIELARDMVMKRIAFAEHISYPAVVFVEGMKSISKEARDYLGAEGSAGLTAGALVMKSVYSTFIGNFFLKLAKPPFPTKIFTDVNEAVKWLEQYKPKGKTFSTI